MSQPVQTRENHARFDPKFHFFLSPLILLLLLGAVVNVVRHPGLSGALIAGGLFALFFAILVMRMYSLRVQDRVIRLEERLRLGMLADASLRPRIPELSEGQLIALRFASDAELPGLAQRALDQKLTSKQIKAAIQTWRPDYWRV